jgi:hypothetical protein
MKTSNEKLESFKLAEKERLKKLHSEPVQVVVSLQDWPLLVRITYNKLQRNERNESYANRNRSGQFRGDTRNINVTNIYGRNLK